MSALDKTIQKLGEGSVVKLDSGEAIFKLDSFESNPIIKPQDLGLTWHEKNELKIGAVFNGGAEVFHDRIMLMPRCHQGYYEGTFEDERTGIERGCLENYVSEVWPLVSEDGVNFTRFKNMAIRGDGTDHQDFTYGIEDIRIVKHSRKYLLIGCGKIKPAFKFTNADRVAIYSTDDFVNITYHGMINCFDSRNAVPFSEPVNDRQLILLRFYPNIHLAHFEAGMEQLLNPSKHIEHWEKLYGRCSQNLLLKAGQYTHEKEKIGPSTQVIKTDRGWLLIYHAVGDIDEHICKVYGLSEKIERGYSVCAALLHLEVPGKVLCRTPKPIYIPSAPYELYGNDQYPIDVPAVVFPVGAIVLKDKLILYAGAADKYIILLSCNLGKLVEYLWNHCQLNVNV
ncbi:MAG: glycoside hydrolase family 130 protein [Candidatus Sifarchaeia archaeon]|jgi:predicted GH43/DUF377 family glycosyl hydrolase